MLTTFIILYMPVRFLLDFLRVSDGRYLGLTPAQWVAVATLAALPIFAMHTRRLRQNAAV
jgi:prolipoprotein diacylglyceryltransferase